MTETLLLIIASLLVVICILGFGILFNVSQAKTGISSLIQVTAALHDVNESLYGPGQVEALILKTAQTDTCVSGYLHAQIRNLKGYVHGCLMGGTALERKSAKSK